MLHTAPDRKSWPQLPSTSIVQIPTTTPTESIPPLTLRLFAQLGRQVSDLGWTVSSPSSNFANVLCLGEGGEEEEAFSLGRVGVDHGGRPLR